MFYLLLSSIFLLPILWGIGEVFSRVFKIVTKEFSWKFIFGIFSLSLVFTGIAFFAPLNGYVEVATIVIGLSSFFWFKGYLQFWDFFSRQKLSFWFFGGAVLFFGSFYPFILDHFGYYVPTVKWISEVGLVKGISNLDLLLGQMSVWHIFQAGFSHFSDPFLRMNGIVLLVYLVFIFEKKSWIHLVFLPILFLFSQSPSTDLPVIVFSLIILDELFKNNNRTGHLFALSVFVFAIKPTMIWLPLLVFLYLVFIVKSPFKVIVPGTFILILFFVKNIWTFGFPVFPVQYFDFDFSWKPNADLLKNSSEIAIMKTYDLQYSIDEINKFTHFDHVKNWFLLKGIKGKINIFFILTLVAFLVYSLIKKSRLVWIVFVSVLVKSVLVLLFSAQYRFFIDVFFVVFFVIFYKEISSVYAKLIFVGLSVVLAGFLSFPNILKTHLPSFQSGSFMGGFKFAQLYQPSDYEWDQFKTHQIGNLKFNLVDGYIFSFQTPIPAISPGFVQEDLDAGIFPQLKGKTLREGFIWKKINDGEKKHLQKILDDYLKSGRKQ